MARVFARDYRDTVAGVVFVDPAHPEDWVTPAPKERIRIHRGSRGCAGTGPSRPASGSRVPSSRSGRPEWSPPRAAWCESSAAASCQGKTKESWRPSGSCPPKPRRPLAGFWTQPKFFEALGSQIESICTSSREALDAESSGYGDLPLVTISSTDAAEYRLRQQEALTRLSTRGRHVVATRSGHWVPLDQPELVINVVGEMVQQIRGGQG